MVWVLCRSILPSAFSCHVALKKQWCLGKRLSDCQCILSAWLDHFCYFSKHTHNFKKQRNTLKLRSSFISSLWFFLFLKYFPKFHKSLYSFYIKSMFSYSRLMFSERTNGSRAAWNSKFPDYIYKVICLPMMGFRKYTVSITNFLITPSILFKDDICPW